MRPHIYIVTYRRFNDQRTWYRLTPKLQRDTVLSVDWKERDLYKGYPIEVLPEGIHGIADKRQFILQNAPVKTVVMLDDDLQFYARKAPNDWHLRDATPEDTEKMFGQVFSSLDEFAHAGVSTREGNNRQLQDQVYATRMTRFLAYHLPTIRKVIKFPLTGLMEDLDITLQLFLRGAPNCVYYVWAQGQQTSNANGGCSTYRTPEYQEECARALVAKYPEFVKLVKRTTKVAWGGGERTDVRVAWKKAFDTGCRS
jgi:hypothetical protein